MIKYNQLVRVIVMFIVMINSILLMNGIDILPYTDEQINVAISSVALVVSEIINHYKNNDYSDEAKEGTEYMHELKEEKKIK